MKNMCENGCEKPVVGFGLCNACYLRKRYAEMPEDQKQIRFRKQKARSKERGYDKAFHERHREKRVGEMRKYYERVSTPQSIEDWKRYIWRRIKINTCGRGEALSLVAPKSEIDALLEAAIVAGDVSLTNPISAPSPDRIDNSKGYVSGNIQIVPRWLNLARNNSDTGQIKDTILEWANKRTK
jgi:hypothetical protein